MRVELLIAWSWMTQNAKLKFQCFLEPSRAHWNAKVLFHTDLAGAQLGREASPALFENKKESDFGKKVLIVSFFVFSIQIVVLRISGRKKQKSFLARLFFLVFLTKYLLKCPNSTKPPLPWNISGCAPVW